MRKGAGLALGWSGAALSACFSFMRDSQESADSGTWPASRWTAEVAVTAYLGAPEGAGDLDWLAVALPSFGDIPLPTGDVLRIVAVK